jgi:hypothetical protein
MFCIAKRAKLVVPLRKKYQLETNFVSGWFCVQGIKEASCNFTGGFFSLGWAGDRMSSKCANLA